jgi:hypothetical protein
MALTPASRRSHLGIVIEPIPTRPSKPPPRLPRAGLEGARVAGGRDANGVALRVRRDGELNVVGRAFRTVIGDELIRRIVHRPSR